MRTLRKKLTVLVLSIFYIGILFAYGSGVVVTAKNDKLLRLYEKGDKKFIKSEIGTYIVYFHQRKIGDALVEKDFTVYQFEKGTKKLIKKIYHRRPLLPEKVKIRFSENKAEAVVEGTILSKMLLFISPASDVFPIRPTPKNPCWAILHEDKGDFRLTVIDAVEGKIVGFGIVPPITSGYAFTGPTSDNPCSGGWNSWVNSGADFFDQLGYETEIMTWPDKLVVKEYVQSSNIKVIYQFGHGGSTSFHNGCIDGTDYQTIHADDVSEWLTSLKKKFVFLGHCNGMCSTDEGTFSYAYRKGSNLNTTTIGYCGMSHDECSNCWSNSRAWQNQMFSYMLAGYPVSDAFNMATADYPMCLDCVRFAGDTDFILPQNTSQFYNISAGSDGTVWGVAYIAGIGTIPVQYDSANNTWIRRDSGFSPTHGFMGMVSVGDQANIWGISYWNQETAEASGRAYRWNKNTQAWERVQNPNDDSVILQAIAAASDGTVIANALNPDGPGYLYKYIGGDTVWEQFDGGAWGTTGGLSVGSKDNIWAINSPIFDDREIIRWTPQKGWYSVNKPSDPEGFPYSVSAAEDTTTWYSTNWGAVWQYNYSKGNWSQVGSRSKQAIYKVSVAHSYTSWGLDIEGKVWRWTADTRKWKQIVMPNIVPTDTEEK